MCAKNHATVFGSFLDIRENAEWPRFFGPLDIFVCVLYLMIIIVTCGLCVRAEPCMDLIYPYYCAYYASVGYCEQDFVAYMERNCPRTCG